MEYTAQWGPKGFLVSASKIVPFTGLQTTVAVKSETQNDTSGTPQTNITGRELQVISFSTNYMSAAGVDPRAQLEEWEALVGEVHTLYIGGKRFGPEKLMLKSVNESEIYLTNDGKFISALVDLSFEEFANGSTTSTEKKATTTSTASSAAKTTTQAKAASVYQQTVANKQAANATANSTDRASRAALATPERRLTTK